MPKTKPKKMIPMTIQDRLDIIEAKVDRLISFVGSDAFEDWQSEEDVGDSRPIAKRIESLLLIVGEPESESNQHPDLDDDDEGEWMKVLLSSIQTLKK